MKKLPNKSTRKLVLGIFLLSILAVISIFGVDRPTLEVNSNQKSTGSVVNENKN